MSFDIFINDPGLDNSMSRHCMAKRVVIAKLEREDGWKSVRNPRSGVALWWPCGGFVVALWSGVYA
jgi:hypothetical protein